MKSELIDVSATRKSLDIEIPQTIVDDEIQHIARDLARKAKVPGFRPGKAPVTVVKTRYKDEIMSEVLQHLLPKYFQDAVAERKLEVVMHTPDFANIDYQNGQPLKFKAVFEVYPQLSVENYVGVPIEEVSITVEDAEVDAALKQLQEESAEMVPVESQRAIQEADFVEISFRGTLQNSDEAPITGEKVVCEVGARTTLKEFNENLTGATVGEERDFSVTYRPDYPEKRLAGNTVDYHLTIEGLKEKKLPELNDEFAQGYGEYQTLDELKAKIRKDIETHKGNHAKEKMREKILEWLEDHNEFEVPPTLVERQTEVRLQRLLRDLARQGINPQRLDVDWSKIREDQLAQAIRDVKGSLIMEYVAEKENIDVSENEIEYELEAIARETQRPKHKVREVLSRDTGLERLKGQIRNRKVMDFLQSKANVTQAA